VTYRRRAIAIALALPLVFTVVGPADATAGGTARVVTSPTSLNFGRVPVGESSVHKLIYITNSTKLPLRIYGFEAGDELGVDWFFLTGTTNDCYHYVVNFDMLLYPGETCAWIIGFRPVEASVYTADFTTRLSDGVNLYVSVVSLRGTGITN
jgi:hypothetical protein